MVVILQCDHWAPGEKTATPHIFTVRPLLFLAVRPDCLLLLKCGFRRSSLPHVELRGKHSSVSVAGHGVPSWSAVLLPISLLAHCFETASCQTCRFSLLALALLQISLVAFLKISNQQIGELNIYIWDDSGSEGLPLSGKLQTAQWPAAPASA